MAVVAGDILFKFSVKTGAAGNATAGSAAGSLGKYISTTEITDATLNNLFDDVTGAENAASDVEYRCIFIHNSNATATLQNSVVWMSAEAAGGAAAAIAIDNTAASAIGASAAQAAEIAGEGSVPSGVGSFSSPTTQGTGLALGDIAAGYCRAVWIKRTCSNTTAVTSDGFTLSVAGDTLA